MASSSPPPLRRELILALGILFAGAVLLVAVGLSLVLPFLDSPGEGAGYIITLFLADLVIIFLFGRWTLDRVLLRPIDRLVEDVQTIAAGSYDHEIRPLPARELQDLARSVDAMARRLIRDQETLADNVRSLDETNLALLEARSQMIRAARLASTGTLASGIAHELGNPLGALMSYVDVARARTEKARGDTELLDSIREEAGRIDRIIRSLLDFARSRETETEVQDPWPVVERVRELLDAQGRFEGVECTWEKRGEDLPVFMDAQRLEQVLVNVILNALDALEGREEPRIRVTLEAGTGPASLLPVRRKGDPPGVNYAHRRRVVSVEEGAPVTPLAAARRVVLLRVEDNGPGLPPGALDQIFDPFFTTKEPGKGTGLGLALSAQLVEGMGGEIVAENGADGGAVFTLRLPEAAEPAQGDEGGDQP